MKRVVEVLNNEAVCLSNQCCNYIEAILYLQRALILCKHFELSHPKTSFSSTTLEKIESTTVSDANKKGSLHKIMPVCSTSLIEPDEGLYSYARTISMPTSEHYGHDIEESKFDDITSFQSIEGVLCFNLGVCYLLSNQDQEADLYFSRTKALLLSQDSIHVSPPINPVEPDYVDEDNGESFRLDSIAVLHNVGLLNFRAGNFEESLEFFVQAMAKSIAMYESQHIRVAIALNSIGVILTHVIETSSSYNNTMTYIDSFEVLNKALSIRLAVLGEAAATDEDTGTVLNNIGRVRFLLNDFEEALNYHHDAYKIRQIALGDYHIDTGVAAFNIGKSYHSLRRPDDAFLYYSLYIKSIFYSPDLKNLNEHVVRAFEYVAKCFLEDKEYEYAAVLSELAVGSARSLLKEKDPYIAQLLNKRGNLYFEFHELDGALASYTQGLAIEMEIYPIDHENVITTRSNIARIHQQRERASHERTEKIVANSIAINIQKLQGMLRGNNSSNKSGIVTGKIRTIQVLSSFAESLSDIFQNDGKRCSLQRQ